MNECTFPTLLLLKLVACLCILVCISVLPDRMERVDSFAGHKVKLRNDLDQLKSAGKEYIYLVCFATALCVPSCIKMFGYWIFLFTF